MKSKGKRIVYLLLWVFTGLLLGILIGGLIEYEYLYLNITDVPRLAIYGIAVLTGIVFGLWVGPKAWKRIYVDGARGKKYVK